MARQPQRGSAPQPGQRRADHAAQRNAKQGRQLQMVQQQQGGVAAHAHEAAVPERTAAQEAADQVKESVTTSGTAAITAVAPSATAIGHFGTPEDVESIFCVVMSPPPEQAARPIPENQDEQDEDADGLQGRRDEVARHGLDDADQDPRDEGARQGAEAAHAHRHERQQSEDRAHGRKDIKERGQQGAGQANGRAAQHPDLGVDAVRRNAEQGRHLAVFRHRLQGMPPPRAIHQHEHRHHDDQRDQARDHLRAAQ
ncbi:hypothetical protein G6F57_016687 [Rhizopus arrhizus]|nr:hypothetical protein G6F57_016687 [Rhizopus arrhizus]